MHNIPTGIIKKEVSTNVSQMYYRNFVLNWEKIFWELEISLLTRIPKTLFHEQAVCGSGYKIKNGLLDKSRSNSCVVLPFLDRSWWPEVKRDWEWGFGTVMWSPMGSPNRHANYLRGIIIVSLHLEYFSFNAVWLIVFCSL